MILKKLVKDEEISETYEMHRLNEILIDKGLPGLPGKNDKSGKAIEDAHFKYFDYVKVKKN